MRISNELKVGLLLASAFLLAGIFAWFMGATNPFQSKLKIQVTYNFAGGIDVGSPVRVAGIKVGRVEKINFFKPKTVFTAEDVNPDQVLTPLILTITVDKDATEGIRQDSKFFINLAGIIGERYIEITPGTMSSPKLVNGDVVRGIDPPRIDQLISQSFNLAGKIQKVIEDNEGDITKSIKMLYDLSSNINKALEQLDKSKIFQTNISQLINNLIAMTEDMKVLTAKTRSPEGEKTLNLLYQLLWRMEPLDKAAIQKFFQQEGIRTRLFGGVKDGEESKK